MRTGFDLCRVLLTGFPRGGGDTLPEPLRSVQGVLNLGKDTQNPEKYPPLSSYVTLPLIVVDARAAYKLTEDVSCSLVPDNNHWFTK